jgi:hypothetical protein
MNTPLTVFVNDQPVRIYRGMQVKHALIAFNQALYQAAVAGELRIEDSHGFQVGLEGALQEGSRIFTRVKSG